MLLPQTDDGHRPFEKLWNSIPAELRTRRLLMSTSDGASLFRGNETGELEEVMEYRAGPEEARRGLPEGQEMEELLSLCRDLVLAFFTDCLEGKHTNLDQNLAAAVDRIREELSSHGCSSSGGGGSGSSPPCSLGDILTTERLSLPGSILPRASMLWRNQAGPMESWCKSGGPQDPWWGFTEESPRGSGGGRAERKAFFTTLFIMAFPRDKSEGYIERYQSRFASLGCHASSAPNSVCVKSSCVDKAAPVAWLASRGEEYGFELSRAVAFGDNPIGNDRPLTTFPDMPFVSVATVREGSPSGVAFWAGNREGGTAAVLRELNGRVAGTEEPTLGKALEGAMAHLGAARL